LKGKEEQLKAIKWLRESLKEAYLSAENIEDISEALETLSRTCFCLSYPEPCFEIEKLIRDLKEGRL